MSHSPIEMKNGKTPGPNSNYRRYLTQLNQLVEDGESWSGHERNCAFLNLGIDQRGQVHFAPVSAVAGLNFLDDGRATALVDWDFDGDLDIWTTNRTAPRIRYLQNDAANQNNFIAFRLIGKTCNRDAIGSIIEVDLSDAPTDLRLVKTLRAGEGFISQSSKWLHFGLGTAKQIRSVTVSWPDGSRQAFDGCETNTHYELTQSIVQPKRISINRRRFDLAKSTLKVPQPDAASHILLSSRIPLPNIPYASVDGKPESLNDLARRPVWLTLWASWCAPCIAELTEATKRRDELTAAGVGVLALSLDNFDSNRTGSTIDDARKIMGRIGFPYSSAVATPETVRRLELIERLTFGRQEPISLPASFLISADGKLAAIYRGPVGIDRLLSDIRTLNYSNKQLFDVALPFKGIWFDGRGQFAPLAIVADLIDHSMEAEAAEYVEKYEAELAHQPGYVEVVGSLGTRLAAQNEMNSAIRMYTSALKVDPNNIAVLNNMAWHLATNQEASHDPKRALKLAERAARLTKMKSSSILDTLATCFLANGETSKAIGSLEQAIKIASRSGNSKYVQKLEKRLADLRDSSESNID